MARYGQDFGGAPSWGRGRGYDRGMRAAREYEHGWERDFENDTGMFRPRPHGYDADRGNWARYSQRGIGVEGRRSLAGGRMWGRGVRDYDPMDDRTSGISHDLTTGFGDYSGGSRHGGYLGAWNTRPQLAGYDREMTPRRLYGPGRGR